MQISKVRVNLWIRCASILLAFFLSSVALSGQDVTLAPQSDQSNKLNFAVATIRPASPKAIGWRMAYSETGFSARNVQLRTMIQEALGAYEPDQVVGGLKWIDTEKFDVEAKVEDADYSAYKNLNLAQRREQLRRLLEDRFGLKFHMEQRKRSVFLMTVAKSGFTLKKTPDPAPYYVNWIKQSQRGVIEGTNFDMPGLAFHLGQYVKKTVIDKTGIVGRYDFTLHWTPDDVGPGSMGSSSSGASDQESNAWPSFFTAVREQMGLRLEPGTGDVQVFVVDDAKQPTEN